MTRAAIASLTAVAARSQAKPSFPRAFQTAEALALDQKVLQIITHGSFPRVCMPPGSGNFHSYVRKALYSKGDHLGDRIALLMNGRGVNAAPSQMTNLGDIA